MFKTAADSGVRSRESEPPHREPLELEGIRMDLTVATYTRSDTDPHWVVPRVNEVVNGLRLLRG